MKQVMKNKFSNIFYIFIATFLINSCSALSPYKVPILQGNIFEEEDIEKLSPEKLAELYDANKAVPTSGILSWLFGR